MRKRSRCHIRGFTLIELLVVIAVIALLLAILVPALQLVKQKAKMIICANNQRQVVYGLSTYGAENRKLPPSASHQNRYTGGLGRYHRPTELNWYSNQVGLDTTRNYDFVGKFLGSYLSDVKVFNCALSSIKAQSAWPPPNINPAPRGRLRRFLPQRLLHPFAFDIHAPVELPGV